MKTFGLIGYPLSHSFSSRFFNEKFRRERIFDCEYLNFPIAAISGLPQLVQAHPALQGLNVTIPYKEQVLPYLHSKDEVVTATGACNCIVINAERNLQGFNTDVTGFEHSLSRQLQKFHTHALVLGTGGAAKAVIFVLQKLGIDFLQVSRQKDRSNSISYDQLNHSVIQDHLLIINTTPVGMFPAENEAPPIDYAALTKHHFLFDLIYNPSSTIFLQEGAQRGAYIQNGTEMLEIQAEESWNIWKSNT